MSVATAVERPRRWDNPFDPDMTDEDVDLLLQRDEFSAIDASRFPKQAPLSGILRNDCRIRKYRPGDIVVREGDYGNSAFLILGGTARVVFPPGLPARILGRDSGKKRSFFDALSQLWTRSRYPEARQYGEDSSRRTDLTGNQTSLLDVKYPKRLFKDVSSLNPDMETLPPLVDEFKTTQLVEGMILGEVAALGRVQRTATVYAETECRMLEMRWQALRDIQKRCDIWRELIEDHYRSSQLIRQLIEHQFLAGLDEATLKEIAADVLFETYGSFEWQRSFKESGASSDEPMVAREGDYPDGLLLIGGGFGRVSMKLGNGRRTLTYLREGDYFGLDELYQSWKTEQLTSFETSLTALGYLHVLRIPYHVLEKHVFPRIQAPKTRLRDASERPIASDAFLEWTVEQRYINGTKTMLIDTEKCARCDDCVRACASTHDGNPRFIRQGNAHGRWMVTNACMHCTDPVCMIGCPTGAIHRTLDQGSVVINDESCIGCGTCANSCPYDNIRLVAIRDSGGRKMVDSKTQEPILKATKCDLCSSQQGGPACVRACPHDALRRVDFQVELQSWREGEV